MAPSDMASKVGFDQPPQPFRLLKEFDLEIAANGAVKFALRDLGQFSDQSSKSQCSIRPAQLVKSGRDQTRGHPDNYCHFVFF